MLTERQEKILDFIRKQQTQTGVTPSTREIQASFAFASQTTVMNELRALKRAAAIAILPRKARAIILPKRETRTIRVPIYGHIPAGMPELSEQAVDDYISIDPNLGGLKPNARVFALRVRGDSMIDAHIVEGDLAVVEIREPRHNDIVAALIDGETTLKRLVCDREKRFLKADNSAYPDLIPAHELLVQGVMVLLVRPSSPIG